MTTSDGRLAIRRADALVAARRPTDAIALLHAALAADPGDYILLCNLSWAHSTERRWTLSLDHAERAIGINPEGEWGHRLASVAQAGLGQAMESLREADSAVSCAPLAPMAHLRRGWALLGAGDVDEADGELRWLMTATTESVDNWRFAAAIAEQRGDREATEAAIRHALAVRPDDASLIQALGSVSLRRGRREQAGKLFFRAAQLDPVKTESQVMLSQSLGRVRIDDLIRIYVTSSVALIGIATAPNTRQALLAAAGVVVLGLIAFSMPAYLRRRRDHEVREARRIAREMVTRKQRWEGLRGDQVALGLGWAAGLLAIIDHNGWVFAASLAAFIHGTRAVRYAILARARQRAKVAAHSGDRRKREQRSMALVSFFCIAILILINLNSNHGPESPLTPDQGVLAPATTPLGRARSGSFSSASAPTPASEACHEVEQQELQRWQDALELWRTVAPGHPPTEAELVEIDPRHRPFLHWEADPTGQPVPDPAHPC
jgi:tetratricopeptide (TPR) repeat protein